MMLGQPHKAAVPELLAFYKWLQGKQCSDLPEELVAIEKQTEQREGGGTILSESRREKEDRKQGRWTLASHVILALTGSTFNGT